MSDTETAVFRKPAKPASPPTPATPAAPIEPGKIIADLLAHPSLEGVLGAVLTQASDLVGGNVKGYAILSRGEDRVVATHGYDADLVGLTLSGPWSAGRSRIVSDGAAELFATNPPELRAKLDVLGMREVKASVVAPLRDRNRFLGALVLDRYATEPFTSVQLDAVSRWATSVTPVVALLESRDEARQLARKLSSVFVESVESLDFDSVGHARRVTDVAQRLGRSLGMNERDLDELWYATMLHDLGKLHGEEGHALVGANLLHEVPQLAGAQQGVRHHHERWDGFGEPDRLAGEEIPLVARIVAVADTFVRGSTEALTRESGRTLDPRLVSALEAVVRTEAPAQA